MRGSKMTPLNPDGSTHWAVCKSITNPYLGPQTVFHSRTAGEGADVGYAYCGPVAPWDESLGVYRAFTPEEMQAKQVCYVLPPVPTPLTKNQKRKAKAKAKKLLPTRFLEASLKTSFKPPLSPYDRLSPLGS